MLSDIKKNSLKLPSVRVSFDIEGIFHQFPGTYSMLIESWFALKGGVSSFGSVRASVWLCASHFNQYDSPVPASMTISLLDGSQRYKSFILLIERLPCEWYKLVTMRSFCAYLLNE